MNSNTKHQSFTNPEESDNRIEYQERHMQIVLLVSFCSRWLEVLYLDETVQTLC